MSIDLGVISKYISERGFGFVRGLLLGNSSEVFFHINVIKKTNPQLAEMLANDSFSEDFFFWFETTATLKGAEVCSILSPEQVRLGVITDPARLIEKIESYWRNVERKKPSWLDDVTSDLVGRDRTDELSLERGHIEAEKQKQRELELEEFRAREAIKAGEMQRLRDAKAEEIQRRHDAKSIQDQIEEDEFQNLLAEMAQFKFKLSAEVSHYIVSNNLGYKYKNISGVLEMELDGTIWNFKGGFPKHIYARLCRELGLSNAGSRARVISFDSFGNIEERSHIREDSFFCESF